jgi:hypothetical protein
MRVVTPEGDKLHRYFFTKGGKYTLVTVRAAIVAGEQGDIVSTKIPVTVWNLKEGRNGATCGLRDPQVIEVEAGLVNPDYGSRFAVLGSSALSGNRASMLFTVPHTSAP